MRRRLGAPRRRDAPRWTAAEWDTNGRLLEARAAGQCEWCLDLLGGRVERHHRQRRRDGGDRLANLVLVHAHCHRHITEHPREATATGHIVRTGHDPAEIPILIGRWVFLDDTRAVYNRPQPTHEHEQE